MGGINLIAQIRKFFMELSSLGEGGGGGGGTIIG